MVDDLKQTTARWAVWFGILTATMLALTAATVAIQVTVDPFGVWSKNAISGFNQRKSGQAGTERIFKLYEYVLREPEVVFLGNSRGAWGLPPVWTGTPKSKVYNLSFDAQRLGDTRALLEFILRTHRPRTVVLNLDTIMMANNAYGNADLVGFSDRISILPRSPFHFYLTKLKETVFSFHALERSIDTVLYSRKKPDAKLYYDHGWYTVKGDQSKPDPREYRESYWRYFNTLHKMIMSATSSVHELYRLVDIAKHHGVELVVSFAPLGADYLLSIAANERIDGLNDIKRKIAAKTPFWDFAYINSVTANRFNYIDSTHYRGVVGEMMLKKMSGDSRGIPRDFGVLVTPKNIDRHLRDTMDKLAVWKTRQKPLYDMLTAAAKHRNKKIFIRGLKKTVPLARR